MTKTLRTSLGLALALALALPPLVLGCAEDRSAAAPSIRTVLKVAAVAAPMADDQADGCAFPRLVRGADGLVHACWVRRGAVRSHSLQYARFVDGGFTAVRTIAEGSDWFVNWADFPSVTANADGTLAAHWLQRNGKGTFSYGVRVACSSDAGESWRPPFWLHEDRQATEHGFVTLVPIDGGVFEAVWLDGRDLPEHGRMTLRSRRFDADGPVGPGVQVDDRVCECCSTAAGRAEAALVVAYRDSEDGVRDISVRRRSGTDRAADWVTVEFAKDGWRNPG